MAGISSFLLPTPTLGCGFIVIIFVVYLDLLVYKFVILWCIFSVLVYLFVIFWCIFMIFGVFYCFFVVYF